MSQLTNSALNATNIKTNKMNIVIIDNYDSFTYNLASLVEVVAGCKPVVLRNDQFELGDLDQFDKIVLSPGPGIPEEAGLLLDVINALHVQLDQLLTKGNSSRKGSNL